MRGAVGVQLGALAGAFFCALIFWTVANRRVLFRWMLREEPAHTLALIRITLPIIAAINLALFSDCHQFLFSNAGLLSGDEAREKFASFGLTTSVDPDSGWTKLGGPNFSLLYIWDAPSVVTLSVVSFYVAALCYSLGIFTRITGWASFLLMNSILVRNLFFWEGTELVIRCFYFCLVLSQCGNVWSVDSWLSKRRGRSVSQMVPSWPRKLMMVQLGAIYLYTGLAKSGNTWVDGDAVYYAMGMDHFARVPLQRVMVAFGVDVLRLLTWATRVLESLFPLCILGMLHREFLACGASMGSHLDERVSSISSIAAVAFVSAYLWLAWPYYEAPFDRIAIPIVALISALALMAGMSFSRRVLRARRVVGQVICSRMLWVGGTVVLQIGLGLVLNIGMFQPAMLVASLSMLHGEEAQRALGGQNVEGALDDDEMSQIARRQHWWYAAAIALTIAAAFGYWEFEIGSLLALFSAVAFYFCAMGLGHLRCAVALAVTAIHLLSMFLGLIPRHETTAEFRSRLAAPFELWLAVTQTEQGWGMFAPNPPRENVFLRTTVYTDDSAWDLETDVYGTGRFPVPYLFYERWRKIARRLSGGETDENAPMLRRYFANYICAHWSEPGSGEGPKVVELERIWYRIPSPEILQERGWYDPEYVRERYARAEVLLRMPCDAYGAESPSMPNGHLTPCCAFGLGHPVDRVGGGDERRGIP